jgi:aminoglycoside phosphotransferase (APT) family kinase protein
VELLERRVAQFGDQLRQSVRSFDTQFENLVRLLHALPQRACSVIHGDLVPPNVLVDAAGRPLAVVDFGFLSSVGDPAFDAAVCASTFDMYGANADEARETLTREFTSRLDYTIDELCVYQAAYAIATSNAYDPGGQDGHFLWCVRQLQRPDLARVLGA